MELRTEPSDQIRKLVNTGMRITLLVADFSTALGSADNPAFRISERGDGDRYIEYLTVFRNTTGFAVNRLTGSQPPQKVVLFVA